MTEARVDAAPEPVVAVAPEPEPEPVVAVAPEPEPQPRPDPDGVVAAIANAIANDVAAPAAKRSVGELSPLDGSLRDILDELYRKARAELDGD